jgi:glycosyltransferase involved in cell wall biosynthesis
MRRINGGRAIRAGGAFRAKRSSGQEGETGLHSLQASIVIPTFNRAALVCRAVESVLAATTPDDEIIVVDDGSTDDTVARLGTFGERVRVVFSAHRGAGAARNHGIRASTRPLIAFLDSDDEWMADKLVLQRALMEHRPDILFSFTDFVSREPSGDHGHQLSRWHHDVRGWDDILGPGEKYSSIAPLPHGREDFLVHVGNLFLAEMQRDYVATFTLVVRREEAGDALRFAEDVPTFEDWECFARIARIGAGAYMDCETAWQYGHVGPRLTDAAALDRAISRLRILSRVWGSDSEFLMHHHADYDRVCRKYYRRLVAASLRKGDCRLAREELRNAAAPMTLRLLASLPAPIAQRLMAWRDHIYRT